ncbi:UDP-glucuronate 4-epimerase [Thermoflavifilum aggregans]|uniref:UDP-glucuronate 4-epimerase n=1 Tax=Thermoflavifilum aggregans TaxID=454188 RepID=A0A2M9CW77_9BACT|nr:NAD-dependent epimerase [Thermoflavifilum aggregans]MBX6381092.1 NAD-dependent epimerase [Thermoflavifilum aggregans]PJJ76058.1 UDP-glucuronate 4-epimerase [Thermoflavifilum aggregans]
MKILITGTAGFIGFFLAKRLIAEGYDVVGLDNINDYYDVRLKYARLEQTGIAQDEIADGKLISSKKHPNYRFMKADLENEAVVRELFETERFDYVCHLAAQAGVRYSLQNPYAYIQSNIVGFMHLLEMARRFPVKHFVYASTSSVYGLNGRMPLSPHHPADHPISLYAATKKSNEMMAHSYSHLFRIPVTGLRFFTVYGPWGRPDMALFLFTRNMLADKPIQVFNHGEMIRDFTYVEDIVEGVKRIIEYPAEPNPQWDAQNPDPASSSAPYRIYNIGNNQPVSLMTYIHAIEKALGKKAIMELLPMQPGDVYATHADVSDLEKAVHYKPCTSVEEGVRRFVEWYRAFYQV